MIRAQRLVRYSQTEVEQTLPSWLNKKLKRIDDISDQIDQLWDRIKENKGRK